MKYQEIMNLLGNQPNEPSKLRTKKWIEKNDSHGAYNINSQIKF